MILYKNNLTGFREHVDTNRIADLVEESFRSKLGRRVAAKEKDAIYYSMNFMEKIVRRAGLSGSCGVLLEYVIPTTSKRIDLVIAGEDERGNKNFVIVELKQWSEAEATDKDGVVSTFLGGGPQNTPHPSYQAYSYKLYLKDYNESVSAGYLQPYSCAYLHNYQEKDPEPLKAHIYKELIEETPIYLKDDYGKLENFLKKYVRYGNGEDILYRIESGKIRPSKKLIDHVTSMFKGNQEFILLDEQKVAYETALDMAKKQKTKTAVIVKGGPGTGKSVISLNLLGGLLNEELNAIFVAPNAAFREVMLHKLAKEHTKTRLKNIFSGSSQFYEVAENTYDVIIVDEAHRLKNDKSYLYRGENQVEDIFKAARVAVFFIDDDQIIRPEDIGSVSEIRKVAARFAAEVQEIELVAQFRCSGAEGFVNWLDNTLQIKETGNYDGWDREEFDFKIFSDPNDLREEIHEKAQEGHNARILAGYAWKWTSAKEGNKDAEVDDIEIPEFDFSMPWNSRKVGSTWAIEESGIHQAGCIHTSQGLEFDYVGVIVGQDLRFDPEKTEYFVDWASYKDTAGKKGLRNEQEELKKFVKNIYKVLMSRGIKGCYVHFTDKETEKHFRDRLKFCSC